MVAVKKNGVLTRRSVCGSGLYGAALVLTGCGGGGGGGGGDAAPAANGASTGLINSGLTGTLYYSFTSTVGAVDLATGNFTEISGKTAGTPARLVFVYEASYFEISPDSKTFYFTDGITPDRLAAVDITGSTVKTVFKLTNGKDWGEIRLSPDGKKFAMVQDRLGSDGRGVYIFETSGNPEPIVYFKRTPSNSNSVWWTNENRLLFSDDGIYLTDPGDLKSASRVSATTSASIAINPAGDKIAYASQGHIWTMGIKGDNAVQVTTGDNLELQPRWSPDGKHIVFQAQIKGTNAAPGSASVIYLLAVIPADGKQYSLDATGPSSPGSTLPNGTVTGIQAGPGVIVLQGQSRNISSRSLSNIAASDMIWR